MVCEKCKLVNKEGATVCKYCGASLIKDEDAAPSSITIDMPVYDTSEEPDEEEYIHDENTGHGKGLIAALIAVGSVVVIAVIALCFIFLTRPTDTGSVTVVTVAPTETPAPSQTQALTPTPAPTDEYDALLEQPANPLGD